MPEPSGPARGALVAAAVALSALGCLRRDHPITIVLCCALPLSLAALPSAWLVPSRRWWWIALAAALAVPRPILLAALAPRVAGQALRGDWLLLACWCAAGLGIALLALALAAWRWGRRWWISVPAVSAVVGIALLGFLPVTLLYPVPWTVAAAADPWPAARALTIAAGDGIALTAKLIEPEGVAADPAGGLRGRGLVVLTHGKGAWKERHAEWARIALDAGWAVLAWDLRGHGHSSLAACGHGPAEADDLVRVWSEARRLAGDKPLVAWGISLGGAATLLAGDRLDGCGGLIVENPFAVLDDLVERNAPGPFAPGARVTARLGFGRWPREIRPVDAPVLRSGPPLLIGAGGADIVVPPSQCDLIAAAAPRARRIVVPEAGHLDLVRSPAWRAAVVETLRSLEAPQSGR